MFGALRLVVRKRWLNAPVGTAVTLMLFALGVAIWRKPAAPAAAPPRALVAAGAEWQAVVGHLESLPKDNRPAVRFVTLGPVWNRASGTAAAVADYRAGRRAGRPVTHPARPGKEIRNPRRAAKTRVPPDGGATAPVKTTSIRSPGMLRTIVCALAAALSVSAVAPAQGDWYAAAEKEIIAASKKNDHAAILRLAAPALSKAEDESGADSVRAYWLAYHLGRSNHTLGKPKEATPHLDRVIGADWTTPHGVFYRAWANVYRGVIARDAKEFDAATRYFAAAQALADQPRLTPAGDTLPSELPFQRGRTLFDRGEFERAAVEFSQQGRALAKMHGENTPLAVAGEENIALCEERLKRFTPARQRREWAASVFEKAYGRDDPRTTAKKTAVATAFVAEGLPAKAEAVAGEIRASLDRRRAASPTAEDAKAAHGLGNLYETLNQTKQQVGAYRLAADLSVTDASNRDWYQAKADLFAGFLARTEGEFAAAEKFLDAADRLAATSQSIRDAVWGEVRVQKAEMYASQGQLDKAIAEYAEQSRAVRHAANNDPEKGMKVEGTIAGLELRAGKPAQAVRRVESVLAEYESAYGQDDNRVLKMRLSLARLLVYANDTKRAEGLIDGVEKVLAGREVERKAAGNNPFRGPPPALDDVPVYVDLASQYHFLARYRDALRVAKSAHDLTVRGGGADKAVVERLWAVSDAHRYLEETPAADDALAAALPIAERLYKTDQAAHAELLCFTLTRYARVHQSSGRYRPAEEMFLRAVRTAEAHPGQRSALLVSCLNHLSEHLTLAGLTDRAEEVAERSRALSPPARAATDSAGRAWELYLAALKKLDGGDADGAVHLFDESQALQHTVERCAVHKRLYEFASALEQRGKFELAVKYTAQEVDYNLRTHGPNYWQTMDARLRLSRILRMVGRYREARAEIEKATAFFDAGDSFNLCKL